MCWLQVKFPDGALEQRLALFSGPGSRSFWDGLGQPFGEISHFSKELWLLLMKNTCPCSGPWALPFPECRTAGVQPDAVF